MFYSSINLDNIKVKLNHTFYCVVSENPAYCLINQIFCYILFVLRLFQMSFTIESVLRPFSNSISGIGRECKYLLFHEGEKEGKPSYGLFWSEFSIEE